MFHFTGYASVLLQITLFYNAGFSHSEITGSKVASHLPDAYRRHATSFVASISLGIHHSLITYPPINSTFEFIRNNYSPSSILFAKWKNFLRKFLIDTDFMYLYELVTCIYAFTYILLIIRPFLKKLIRLFNYQCS